MFDLFGLRQYALMCMNPKTEKLEPLSLLAISPEDAQHLATIRGLKPIRWATIDNDGNYRFGDCK